MKSQNKKQLILFTERFLEGKAVVPGMQRMNVSIYVGVFGECISQSSEIS